MTSLNARISKLKERCNFLNSQNKNTNNRERRQLHAEASILEMDIEDEADINDSSTKVQLEAISQIIQQLDLHFVRRPGVLTTILDIIDEVIRIAAVWMFLVDSALLLAIPTVVLDTLHPRQRLTIYAKQFVGHMCLILSAVDLTITGISNESFESGVSLLCFSHASTMDAFILSAAVPVRHYSLAKSQLFMIPFFSWHLAAYGGVAIDRSDKNQAISALSAAAASASTGDCVAVAPEGTRSKTGQLLSFKKGPFYLWESLQATTIPVIIYGAYELYPPGKQMSLPGKVVMHFLKPIKSTEASTREAMSRLLRRRMLEALRNPPENVGDLAVVTWRDRILNVLAILFIFVFNTFVVYYGKEFIVRNNVPIKYSIAGFVGIPIIVTIILYIFKVYIQPIQVMRRKRNKIE